MNGLCGWVTTDESQGSETLERMLARMPQPVDGVALEIVADGRAALAAPKGRLARRGQLVAGIAGMPYWTDSDLAAAARRNGMAASILEAWQRSGSAFLASLNGPFSIAVLDGEKGRAFLASDRAGRHPLAYAPATNSLAFASSVQTLRGFPGFDDTVPLQAVLTYLFYYVMPAPMTVYAGGQKLQPGECLEWTEGRAETRRYHAIDYALRATQSFDDYRNQLHTALRQAVSRALEGADIAKVGAFLSGGLDSSTVTGLLAEISDEQAKTFTIGFDEPGYDESGYARVVAEAFGTDHHTYYVTPRDVADVIPKIAQAYDEPFGNHSAVPTYYCAKLAREAGVDLMLAGDGGDELFAGNERYVTIGQYAWGDRIPPVLRHGLILPVARIPGLKQWTFFRRIQGLMRYLDMPMPDRLYAFDFFTKEPLSHVFDQDRLAKVDLEEVLALTRATYQAPASGSTIQRLMHMDLHITLADNDLRKVSQMAGLAGVSVRFPMLDDDVMHLAATVPETLLLAGGELRGFYKRAMRGFLPSSVLSKKKHGFGLPFARWLKTDPMLKEMVDSALTRFARRDILRERFITTVKESHHQPEPTLIDRFAWDIMMLELWWEKQQEGSSDGTMRSPQA